jgi:hypothetical protein
MQYIHRIILEKVFINSTNQGLTNNMLKGRSGPFYFFIIPARPCVRVIYGILYIYVAYTVKYTVGGNPIYMCVGTKSISIRSHNYK